MSLNTAHVNDGVLIHAGECILLFSDNVHVEWVGQGGGAFNGTKKGKVYLTTHRVIFTNSKRNDPMLSFSIPFVTLSGVQLEQPIFGANFVTGEVRAQPDGNWTGEVKFKMTFKSGGAVDFSLALLKVVEFTRNIAQQMGFQREMPPPYTPPPTAGGWYAAPPPAYAPPAQGYYGWQPPQNAFPDRPPQNGVFMMGAPPPYPGIVRPPAPNQQHQPYPYAGAAAGGTSASAAAKQAEAAQSAYYNPDQPQTAFVPPPPAYYEQPPPYAPQQSQHPSYPHHQ